MSENAPMPPSTPTTKASLLGQFVESVHELFTELGAWRRFGAEVSAWMKERSLSEEFGEWQRERAAGSGVKTKKRKR